MDVLGFFFNINHYSVMSARHRFRARLHLRTEIQADRAGLVQRHGRLGTHSVAEDDFVLLCSVLIQSKRRKGHVLLNKTNRTRNIS